MQDFHPNCPQFIVGEAIPLAREILRVSQRLAFELVQENSQCSAQEYLIYLTNATTVLSTIVAHQLVVDGKHV